MMRSVVLCLAVALIGCDGSNAFAPEEEPSFWMSSSEGSGYVEIPQGGSLHIKATYFGEGEASFTVSCPHERLTDVWLEDGKSYSDTYRPALDCTSLTVITAPTVQWTLTRVPWRL